MIRREKKDVGTQLPTKSRSRLLLDLPEPKRLWSNLTKMRRTDEAVPHHQPGFMQAPRGPTSLHSASLACISRASPAHLPRISRAPPAHIPRISRASPQAYARTGECKAPAVLAHLRRLLGSESGHKCLVFAHHKARE